MCFFFHLTYVDYSPLDGSGNGAGRSNAFPMIRSCHPPGPENDVRKQNRMQEAALPKPILLLFAYCVLGPPVLFHVSHNVFGCVAHSRVLAHATLSIKF